MPSALLFQYWGRYSMSPDYELIVNGSSITKSIRDTNRLIDLQIIDKLYNEADELTLTLSDHDQRFRLPPTGGIIEASIGFSINGFSGDALVQSALGAIGLDRGDLVSAGLATSPLIKEGLYFKGKFTIDSVQYDGPPNQIRIQATAADFRGKIKVRRNRGWDNVELGDLVRHRALHNGLEAVISPEVDRIFMLHLDQTNESDVNFLDRVARDHGAIVLFKEDKLILMPRNKPKTALGTPMPDIYIDIGQVERFNFSDTDRSSRYSGVIVYYVIPTSGIRRYKRAGVQGNEFAVRESFNSPEEAQAKATATWKELKISQKALTIDLATGTPEAQANSPVKLTNFNRQIMNIDWMATKITHTINDNGYTGTIECEPIEEEDDI
jgi:phage protein D